VPAKCGRGEHILGKRARAILQLGWEAILYFVKKFVDVVIFFALPCRSRGGNGICWSFLAGSIAPLRQKLAGKLIGDSREVVKRPEGTVCCACFYYLQIRNPRKAGGYGMCAQSLGHGHNANILRTVTLGCLGNRGHVIFATTYKFVLK